MICGNLPVYEIVSKCSKIPELLCSVLHSMMISTFLNVEV